MTDCTSVTAQMSTMRPHTSPSLPGKMKAFREFMLDAGYVVRTNTDLLSNLGSRSQHNRLLYVVSRKVSASNRWQATHIFIYTSSDMYMSQHTVTWATTCSWVALESLCCWSLASGSAVPPSTYLDHFTGVAGCTTQTLSSHHTPFACHLMVGEQVVACQ